MISKKRAMAMGSALVAVALMAACTAPIPENGAMPTVTPQDEPAKAEAAQGEPAAPDAPAPASAPESDGQETRGGPRQGPMGQRGMGFDVSALDDPDKPEGAPTYAGTFVAFDGNTLMARVTAYTAELQAPANPSQGSDDDRQRIPQAEQKAFTLSEAFRVKKAVYNRPESGGGQDAGQGLSATLSELTKDQLQEGERITLWADAAGNVTYAIVMESPRRSEPDSRTQGGSRERDDRPQGERR